MRGLHFRHCMVVHAYYPIHEPRVEREADELCKSGYQVDVICLRHEGAPPIETINGIKVYRLPLKRYKSKGAIVQFFEYWLFFWLAMVKLTVLHLQHRYDSVQVHTPPDFLVFAALVPKVTGTPVLLDIHDLLPEFYMSRFGCSSNNLLVRLIGYQEKLACRFADHIITVSKPWQQTLIHRGVSPDKCSVVMNIAGQRFRQGAFLRDSGSSPVNGTFRLIYHGTLTRRYGIDLVLKAVSLLKQEVPLQLIIHGRGEFLEELEKLAKELQLENCVRFSSHFIPTEELPHFLKQADVGLVPYRSDIFTDGILPTKLMEYAAVGIPAIVARTSGVSAYFDETMVEFFTPEDVDDLASRIRFLYCNQTRREELRRNTEKFNQRFDWTNQAEAYLALVNNLT